MLKIWCFSLFLPIFAHYLRIPRKCHQWNQRVTYPAKMSPMESKGYVSRENVTNGIKGLRIPRKCHQWNQRVTYPAKMSPMESKGYVSRENVTNGIKAILDSPWKCVRPLVPCKEHYLVAHLPKTSN